MHGTTSSLKLKALALIALLPAYASVCAQTDSLQVHEIGVGIVGHHHGVIENAGQDFLISVSRTHGSAAPHDLTFIHTRGDGIIFRVTFRLRPDVMTDTLAIRNLPRVLPNDKFVLKVGNLKSEYTVASTKASLNTPHYMDFMFIFNGDTIQAKDFFLPGMSSLMEGQLTRRVYNFQPVERLSIRYKRQTIVVDLLPQQTSVIFHGSIVIGYVERLRSIERRDDYEALLSFAKQNGCTGVTLVSLNDLDQEINQHQSTTMRCVD
jgi:hypothetical protein